MKNLSTHRVIHSPSSQFTLGVVLALTIFSLTVNAQDPLDPNAPVVRYNSNGEITASGTDIDAVQTATGAAEGDVIKVSDGAAFNTRVTNPVNNFTIESASNDVINVPVQAGYNFTQTPTDPFNATFRNVSFTSADRYTSCFWGGDNANLTCDNVTFARFNEYVLRGVASIQGNVSFVGNVIDGAINNLTDLSGSGNTLKFSGNKTYFDGGAITIFDKLSSSGNTLIFTSNIAQGGSATWGSQGGGAICNFHTLSGNNNILTFTGNKTEDSGGAIYHFGNYNGTGGLTGDNNKLTFSNNKANCNTNNAGGGAIYELVGISGSGNILEFSENTAEKIGGAINKLTDLSGNNNKLTFSKNTANGTGDTDGGGAIYQLALSGSGNKLKFEGNTAATRGGAIYQLGVYVSGGTASGGLTGNNNKLTFSNNTANGTGTNDGGGAIYEFNLSGSGNILDFSENTSARHGGAIKLFADLSGENNIITFSGNTADKGMGGAIGDFVKLSGSYNKLTFSNNKTNSTTATYIGGAIGFLHDVSGSYNTLEFTGNTAVGVGGAIGHLLNFSGSGNTLEFSENTSPIAGGAINEFKLTGSGNTLIFTGNTAEGNGGAIGKFRGLSGSNNTLTFTGNKAGGNGGAIYSNSSIEFNGNNTLTFTGNKAGEKGNDIYLYDLFGNRPANLTFNGGTYSFDGGIWLDKHPEGEIGKTTISNGAKVTIAGRNDDSVNEYELANVTLNANLTATVDDIEYLHGNFSVGENGLMTIKKGSDTATIKSSSNDGVMDLLYNSGVETISISSGRIDIKGCIDASIELQNDATFSPGNSVGHVDIDGDFILNAGTTLLIEMDATGIDTMAATSFDLDNGTISFTLSDEIPGGATYDILTAKNGTAFDEDIITRILNGQTLPEYYTLALAGPSNNIVRFSIDRNAVPEPSTWALLILGAAGLAYMRKRSRQ